MKKGMKNFLIGAGVTAAGAGAFAAATYKLTKTLIQVALDRESPKTSEKAHQKLTGSFGQNMPLEQLNEASEKLKNSDCETVEITAQDGVRLVGHLQRSETAKRVILAMHGWRSAWYKDFGIISDFYNDNDCTVLYAEQRGQGESGGEYMGFGLTERYDCLDWINWLNQNGFDNLPIYLAGISMGATTVLMTAGFDLPENVHGIMADCGFTSPHDIWKHIMENNLHLSYNGLTASVANDICKKKIQFTSKDYSCLDAMRACKIPVLFAHGTDDHFVPVEMTYENYKACAAPKRLLVVPGAEHGMSYLVDTNGYQNAVKAFWHDFD